MKYKKFGLFSALLFSGCLFFSASTASAESYTVKKGDTLYSIAKKYNITTSEIQRNNNLTSTTINLGQVLALSVPVTSSTNSSTSSAKTASANATYKTLRVSSTAYTANCSGCSGRTKTGINLRANPNVKVIAVDPKVIPLGTKVWVEGYGTAVAADIGGSIKGNKIDVFMSTKKKANSWGRKMVTIKIYNS